MMYLPGGTRQPGRQATENRRYPMSTLKYIIELTPGEHEKLMSALVDLKRDNMEDVTRCVANGETGPYLERLISWDTDLQHLFTLTLYAKMKEVETNAE